MNDNIIKIIDLNDSRLDPFRSLKFSHLKDENLIAESSKVIEKLIKTPLKIFKVLCHPKYVNLYDFKNAQIYTAEQNVLENLVGHHLHQGLIVLCERPSFVALDQLDDKILIMNGLTSPENVGAIVRNIAAFNIQSLIIDRKTCSPYLRRCIRVSTGNIFNIKVHQALDLKDTLFQLQKKGHQIISTANIKKAISIKELRFQTKSALIIGSEGHGIDKNILESSDLISKIIVNQEVKHLNAACSSAIFLYHWSS